MTECSCGGKSRILYACSGAADVGKIADETARRLAKEGFGKMTCLAGIGARLSGYVESAKGASENIVIDGCPVACGKKQFEQLGIAVTSYILADMGLVKGGTPATESTVADMAAKIGAKLAGAVAARKPGAGSCCG